MHGRPGETEFLPQLALDEAVAAIRRGDAERAIAHTQRGNPAAFTALIAEMTMSDCIVR